MLHSLKTFSTLASIPLSFFLVCTLYAQDVDIFNGPERDHMETPNYPELALRNNTQGFVDINVMIDTQGKPFEAVVQSVGGGSGFEQAVLRALNQSTFKPATLNGEPIESSYTYRNRFLIDNSANSTSSRISRPTIGANRNFVQKFEDFTDAFGSEIRDDDDIQNKFEELIEFDTNNLYEYAHLNLAKYYYSTLHGSSLSQMEFLTEALYFSRTGENRDNYLSEEFEKEVRRTLFNLQVSNNYLDEAVVNYKIIERNGDIEGVNLLKPLFDKILSVQNDETAYNVDGILNNNGTWSISLFKDQFYIDNIQGTINELKFRCQRKYVFVLFDPALDFSIPDTWGQCHLQIIGEKDASFGLVQY